MKGALLAVLLCGCLVDNRMFQTKSLSAQRSGELRAAEKLLPTPLEQPRHPAPKAVTTLKVRAWADPAYRRRMHWREHLAEIVRGANAFLTPAVGVVLEVDPRPWDRDGAVEDLDVLLEDLARKDPGDDVDHVLGLTGALPRFSATHEMLGRALAPGKHFVMRALNDAEEMREIGEALPRLTAKELEALTEARTAHKEVAVLIHEWAHNYAAMHEDGRDLLMGQGYHHTASRLSEANRELVTLAVLARRGDEDARQKLLTHVSTAEASWHPRDREMVLAALGGTRLRAGMAGMSPVIQRAPGADREETVENALTRAGELQEAGKLRAALDVLDAARGGARDEMQWMRLAQAYLVLGAFQRALDAVAHGEAHPQAADYREKVLLLARQRGLFGVPAEEEPEANAAIEAAHEALGEIGARKAKKLVAAGLARWKRVAGLLALRCAIELGDGSLRAAEASCARAVAAGEEAVMAHYFAGHVALRLGKRAAAAQHLERVLALDPGARAAYEALATVYKQGGEKEKLDRLRAEHLRRFKRSL